MASPLRLSSCDWPSHYVMEGDHQREEKIATKRVSSRGTKYVSCYRKPGVAKPTSRRPRGRPFKVKRGRPRKVDQTVTAQTIQEHVPRNFRVIDKTVDLSAHHMEGEIAPRVWVFASNVALDAGFLQFVEQEVGPIDGFGFCEPPPSPPRKVPCGPTAGANCPACRLKLSNMTNDEYKLLTSSVRAEE